MAVTIKDIAAAAGVSPSTVSRTCKDSPSISRDTKERIRRIMAQMGYEPNFEAEPSEAFSKTIGIILPSSQRDVYENAFHLEIIRGIGQFCNQRRYVNTVITGEDDAEVLDAIQSMVANTQADGFILLYSKKDCPVAAYLRSEGLLHVIVGKAAQSANQTIYIDNDNALAGEEATDYLYEMGHRRIAYFGVSNAMLFSAERKRGYQMSLLKHDITPREGDCVVVSLNHRLNILGYLDLSDFGEEYANSGNAGGDDIILALRWVRDNIAAFGGDPGCVTVFGQSGGGAKVTTLLQTPAADGLYHRAMIMSGVLEGLLNDSVGSGRDCVQALMQELGVQTAQQLETVPYHQLAQAYRNVSPALKAKGANVGQSPHPNRFYLGDPLHNGSGFRPETADIPVLIGTVYSEFYGFFDGLKGVGPEEAVGLSAAETLRKQFRTAYPHRPEEDLLLADTSFRAPTIKYVRERAKAGGKVYSYLFDQDFPLMGKSTPWHCADIPFVFHNTELVPVCAFEGAKQLEAEIFGAVMQFARTGAPGWAASTEDVEQTMLFGPQSRLVQNHDHALIEALAPFTDLRMKKATRAGGQIQH